MRNVLGIFGNRAGLTQERTSTDKYLAQPKFLLIEKNYLLHNAVCHIIRNGHEHIYAYFILLINNGNLLIITGKTLSKLFCKLIHS